MTNISVELDEDGRQCVIKIHGRFDFSAHRDFREAYRSHAATLHYSVDLTGTEYLDSSALGMLLLLREHAGGDSAKIRLITGSDEVRRLLAIARFDQLFAMD